VDEGGVPRGSNPHVVHVGSPLMTYWLYGWTADDEILTGIYRPGNTTALAFLSLSTGDIRILKSFDWRDPRAVLSHDGKHVAYDHPSGENPVERDIYVMSVEEGREDVLVAIPGRDVVLGWLPGDSGLLFYSERSGSPSVWRLPMSDGRAAGPAELVLQEARKMQPLGLVGEELYFGIEVETPSYRTATIDWERARVAATPMTFGDPYGSGGLTRAFTWSADGTHVVHDVSGPNGSWFYLRTAAGGVVGEWRFDLSLIANPAYARWVPGTQAVMVGGIDGRGRGGFFRIDLEAGEFTLERRLEHQGVLERSFSVSSDGRRLYFTGTTDEASEDDGIIEIVELDLVSGRERSVHRVSHLGQVVPSPDGSVVAYHGGGTSAPSTLEIFPVDDGQPMTLHRIDTGNLGGIVGWAPDGEAVLFLVIPSPISRVAELWAASRDGGQATKLGELPDYAGGWSLHPDGRRLAYRSGRRRGEVWALDLGSRPVDADVSGGMRP
jgi:hypothetical protein